MTVRSSRPRKVCPDCRTELDGGPIRYRCSPCRRGISAADAVTEIAPAAPVTFWGEVRKGLPEVVIRTGIVAFVLEVGHLTFQLATALGVIS